MALAQHALAPWRARLQSSLAQNKSLVYSKYVQLATVRPDGTPACRTVVFRWGRPGKPW
jgi:pyridoxamine 5'-phosphate oxidase